MKTDFSIVEHQGVTLELHYEYEPSDTGDYYTPPSGGYLSIYEVHHKGEDIIHILDPKVIEKLENDLYEREVSY